MEKLITDSLEGIRRQSRYRELSLPSGLSFVHNDYLGLSTHPALLEAGSWALSIAGAGHRGSRLLGGHSRLFEDTEARLAQFFEAPSALFFSTGYLANLAACQVLGDLVDVIVSDEKVHASLIDGIRLTGKPKIILPHNRWEALPESASGKRQLVVAESLYSMDGDLVEGEALQRHLARSESFLLIDEAHAAGVFFEDGRGVSAGFRDWDRTAAVVTFGKAFGVAGAAILCSAALRELLINTARAFIYTTAAAPAVVAMVGAALDVLEKESWRRNELWDRAVEVRRLLREANTTRVRPMAEESTLWNERSPIVPFLLPGEDNALRFCENMRKSGLELRAIRYPTVPKGTERIRISLSLSVSRENTEGMAKEVVRQWKAFSSQE